MSLVSWETCMQVKKQQLEQIWNNRSVPNWEGSMSRLYIVTCFFNLYAEYTCKMPGWSQDWQDKYQQLQMSRWYHSNGRKQRGTTESLDEGKGESEKAGLKLSIQRTNIMASVLITSWQIDGEKLETVTTFIFLGSKITVDGEGSHEIKKRLLLGRKAMKNLDNVSKSRHQFSKQRPV